MSEIDDIERELRKIEAKKAKTEKLLVELRDKISILNGTLAVARRRIVLEMAGKGCTHREIADYFEISQCRATQLVNSAKEWAADGRIEQRI